MRTQRVDTTIFGAASLLTLALGGVAPEQLTAPAPVAESDDAAALVGVWLSADEMVRLQLAADWSFQGSVAGRHREARGTYRPEGGGLVLRDVSGLRTPVTVAEHALEMAGHQLFRA